MGINARGFQANPQAYHEFGRLRHFAGMPLLPPLNELPPSVKKWPKRYNMHFTMTQNSTLITQAQGSAEEDCREGDWAGGEADDESEGDCSSGRPRKEESD